MLKNKNCPYCKNGFKAHYGVVCLNRECKEKCDCECHYEGLKCMCTQENCEYEHEDIID